jgi:MFS transporter, DHA1 family, multidrug resistance protein
MNGPVCKVLFLHNVALLNPRYLLPFIIVFVLAFGLSAYETVLSLFSNHKFGFTPKDIAAIITISSTFGVVIQVFMFGKMVDILPLSEISG